MAGTSPYGQWHTSATEHDDVRTIFVSGFPPDTKERELQNLLRWWPGYEACQLTFKNDVPMGFALFSTPAMAFAARDALQGLIFDTETSSALRAEMAKKNLFVKKGVVATPSHLDVGFDPNKRLRTESAFIGGYGLAPPPLDPFGRPLAVPGLYAPAVSVPSYSSRGGSSGGGGGGPTKDNPPCNTLFVGNLGESVSEAELHSIFASQPGFRQMKLLRQPHATVCFVEYMDIPSATAVHDALQGITVSSSDRGTLRIQFSKNPFGRKKDGSYDPASAVGAAVAAAAVAGAAAVMAAGVEGVTADAGLGLPAPPAAPGT